MDFEVVEVDVVVAVVGNVVVVVGIHPVIDLDVLQWNVGVVLVNCPAVADLLAEDSVEQR